MSGFNAGRRAFATVIGGLLATPGVIAVTDRQTQRSQKVSGQELEAALQLTGEGLTQSQIDRIGRALEMLARDLETVRRFPVPGGVEPSVCFRAR